MRGYHASFGPSCLRGKTLRDLAESVATCSPDRKVRQAVAAMVWWDICDVPFYKEDPYMPQFREFALKYDPVEHDDYDSWAVLAATMNVGYPFRQMRGRTDRPVTKIRKMGVTHRKIQQRDQKPCAYSLLLWDREKFAQGFKTFWAGNRLDTGEPRKIDGRCAS